MEGSEEKVFENPYLFFNYDPVAQYNMVSRMGWPSIINLCDAALLILEKRQSAELENRARHFFTTVCKSADFWKLRIKEDFGPDIYDELVVIAEDGKSIQDPDFWKYEYKNQYDEAGTNLVEFVDDYINESNPKAKRELWWQIRRFLDLEVDPNQLGGRIIKTTPLLKAAASDDIEITQLLLQAKANPNLSDKEGTTPLIEASREGNDEMVDLLLETKVDPNVSDKNGLTSLDYAIEFGHDFTEELLLQAGALPL